MRPFWKSKVKFPGPVLDFPPPAWQPETPDKIMRNGIVTLQHLTQAWPRAELKKLFLHESWRSRNFLIFSFQRRSPLHSFPFLRIPVSLRLENTSEIIESNCAGTFWCCWQIKGSLGWIYFVQQHKPVKSVFILLEGLAVLFPEAKVSHFL